MATAGMLEDESVLSDVHVGRESMVKLDDKQTAFTRFVVTRWHYTLQDPIKETLDEEGDLVVPRKEDSFTTELLTIEHVMSTKLPDVGQQVWRGALALSDFIFHESDRFNNVAMLELGCGVGLVSIVASHFCKSVYCTDIGPHILDICQRNVHLNAHFRNCEVHLKQLDWFGPFKCSSGKYSWQPSDMSGLNDVKIILAADVIYDDSMTDAFLNCLINILYTKLKEPVDIYMATEKRVVFTLEDMAPVVPAYKHFQECLEKRHYTDQGDCIKIEAVPISLIKIPKCFDYVRVDELVLGEFAVHRSNCTRNFYRAPWFADLMIIFKIYLSGLMFALILTELGKISVGKLRPHFIDACKPNFTTFNCSDARRFPVYVNDFKCYGDPKLIIDARLSWPSGHASLSAFVSIFIAILLSCVPMLPITSVLYVLLTLTLLVVTLLIGLSRISDNKHHPIDVICGWILGAIVACAITFINREHLWDLKKAKQEINDRLVALDSLEQKD